MAENLKGLYNLLQERIKECGSFEPHWSHNPEGDCIEAWWDESSCYAQRINNSITLLKDNENDRIVGVILKNLEYGLKRKDPNEYHRGD